MTYSSKTPTIFNVSADNDKILNVCLDTVPYSQYIKTHASISSSIPLADPKDTGCLWIIKHKIFFPPNHTESHSINGMTRKLLARRSNTHVNPEIEIRQFKETKRELTYSKMD